MLFRSADSLDEKPHFMIVGYDPDVINSKDLLLDATRNGLHAELIGL